MGLIWALVIGSFVLTTINCQSTTSYRLNSEVSPSAYEILISPDFDNNSFTGHVSIKLSTNKNNVKQIKLHSDTLTFEAKDIKLTEAGGIAISLASQQPVIFDQENTFAYINLASKLKAHTEYTLQISYNGTVFENFLALFSGTYYTASRDKSTYKGLQTTVVNARAAFPCFDEPAYKATFTWTVDRPPIYKRTLANTEIVHAQTLPNGYIRETFATTPIMSTYLNSFIMSNYELGAYSKGDKPLEIYARPTATNQTAFAFESATKYVKAYSEYFDVDYYSLIKSLKYVSIQDYNYQGMEYWGNIFILENSLLFDEQLSSPSNKPNVAINIAHETFHTWLGNLLTCHWWSDVWLQEGFAAYFEVYLPYLVTPELGTEDIELIVNAVRAYDFDSSPSVTPMSYQDVNSYDAIAVQFGTVSYHKAAKVIKMVHRLIGDEAFQTALRIYVQKKKFGVVYPSDLYAAFEDAVSRTNAMSSYPETNITALFNTWATQPGYPLIDVTVANGSVTITQRRFYKNQSITSNEIYPVPITYLTHSYPYGKDRKPAFIFNEKTKTIDLKEHLKDSQWIILNTKDSGYYRVNYDMNTWQTISKALQGTDRTKILLLNRVKIMYDIFRFYDSGMVDFALVHSVVEFLREETEYAPWYAAVDGFANLYLTYETTALKAPFERYLHRLLNKAITTLGFTYSNKDTFVQQRARLEVTNFACRVHEPRCLQDAQKKFQKIVAKKSLKAVPAGDIRVSVCYGLRAGSASDFDLVFSLYERLDVGNLQSTLLLSLGCTGDQASVVKFLETTALKDGPIRRQLLDVVWSGTLYYPENLEAGLSVLQRNYTALEENGIATSVANRVVQKFRKMEQIDQFTAWLNGCKDCTDAFKTATLSNIAAARIALATANARFKEIDTVIRQDHHPTATKTETKAETKTETVPNAKPRLRRVPQA